MNGRAILDAWAFAAGERWSTTSSGESAYRLLFDGQKVLYCYDTENAISAFVEHVSKAEARALLAFGASPNGYDEKRTGIRISVDRRTLMDLLDWSRRRLERTSQSV